MNLVKSDTSAPFSCTPCIAEDGKGEFILAHLSDPHLTSSSTIRLRDLLSKRLYGYLSWRLHRHTEHQPEILAALVQDLRRWQPDHIALTGDLIHLSLPAEYLEAEKLLESLGPPSRVTVVPGNHDAYVPGAWERARQHWGRYMVSDSGMFPAGLPQEHQAPFPIARIAGSIALIGVSTARPTLPFRAAGSIGKAQLRSLEGVLAEARRRKLLRVVLLHHPPLPGAVSRRKRLTDSAQFHALLCREGAELILHGHTHRSSFGELATPWGPVAVIGVPSASALGRTPQRRARYHLFRIIFQPGGVKLRISVQVYSPGQGCFVLESERRIELPHQPCFCS